MADGVLAGFIGYHGNSLVLHAVAPAFRGRGLAKHWWRLSIEQRFAAGHASVTSSISAANVAVLNLYASLGFSFLHPQDIYHRIVR
jgi:ribosomal protein S18 acetylase RimI-like enzyme